MSDAVQSTIFKKPTATGPRWTGRKRDPERFRARLLMHLRAQTGYRAQRCDPAWRQIAWEAWHIVKHFYAHETCCHECAPFIRAPLFPVPPETESEEHSDAAVKTV